MKPYLKSLFKEGDCLLYKPSSLFGKLIAIKTWNRVSHVEVYAGGGVSFASRDGQGVNCYTFRSSELSHVLRPKVPFDFQKAKKWFYEKAIGQKYDWLGLLVFTLAVNQGAQDRMFCSEFVTRFYRMGDFEPFQPSIDADHVAPAQFLYCSEFQEILLVDDNKQSIAPLVGARPQQ